MDRQQMDTQRYELDQALETICRTLESCRKEIQRRVDILPKEIQTQVLILIMEMVRVDNACEDYLMARREEP